MEHSFLPWMLGFLGIFLILHFLCRPSAKQKSSFDKWDREYKILHECGIFGVDLNKDHRLSGCPLFHCYAKDYQKAFDIIFSENQETTWMNGEMFIFKRNIRAIKIFEEITNRRFNLSDDSDLYLLFYSLLLANNKGMTLRADEFLSYVYENELKNSKKKPFIKEENKKHIPAFLLETTISERIELLK